MKPKKKTWRDYKYSNYQFRADDDEKKTLDELFDQALESRNQNLKPDDFKVTKGKLAVELLERGLTAEIRKRSKP